ncbi:11302_t:CDS:2 [Funneliformis geosporum]|uniref:4341_t:CDS:1 n=1 Tax=Funneliformis geosporum TaxID=1117311 RepID=A0A9W4SNR4_9GLOM|nr:11302_t:CDS:2 [Funneliformis geosporum]CAI2176104.1 4341_t:CDS:2 [Funneliformis geosporum]
MWWIYIVDTLEVLANVIVSVIAIISIIVIAWIVFWKLILSQISFIREIAELPKLNDGKTPQSSPSPHREKKKRQPSTSSSASHSRQQSTSQITRGRHKSISSAHSRHQSLPFPSHNRQQSASTRQKLNNINANNPIIHQRTFSSSSLSHYQDGGSLPMSRRTSNRTYQSQDDDSDHKSQSHTKSNSRTSIKNGSSKIVSVENDEFLNFEEGYIS